MTNYRYFIEDTRQQHGMWYYLNPRSTYILSGDPSENWTNDPHEALAFISRENAQLFLKQGFPGFTDIIVTEHEFVENLIKSKCTCSEGECCSNCKN